MQTVTLEIESEDEFRALEMALENIDGFLEDTVLDSLHLNATDVYDLSDKSEAYIRSEMSKRRKEADKQLDLLLATKALLRKIK